MAKYLFLDRDGVLNQRIVGGYVQNVKAFQWLDGVLDAMPILAAHFARIILVTNQQGIGKGLMTHADLEAVHKHMQSLIEQAGGRLDAMYYCPDLAKDLPYCRKPRSGMAAQAQTQFPEIDFNQSVMVGDSPSDLDFGQRLGMHTVWIQTREDLSPQAQARATRWAKEQHPSLYAWAKQL